MNTDHANIDELAAGIRLERPVELTWTGQPLIAPHMTRGRSAAHAICS